MLDLQNISVIYAKNTVLEKKVFDKLNLCLNEGEFVAVIGNNGTGKSTLAKLIAGEILPESGKIIIDGVDCTSMSVVKRSPIITRVFQNPSEGTAFDLTILEHMAFANSRGCKRHFTIKNFLEQNREYFITKLATLNMQLETKIDYAVGLLSGGQRQALSLLLATLQPAKILILDEHTSSLDPSAADVIMKMTSNIVRKNKITTLMITHDMQEASYCDKILHISKI